MVTLNSVGCVLGDAVVLGAVRLLHPGDGEGAVRGADCFGVQVTFGGVPSEGDGRGPTGHVTDEREVGALFDVLGNGQGCEQGFPQILWRGTRNTDRSLRNDPENNTECAKQNAN